MQPFLWLPTRFEWLFDFSVPLNLVYGASKPVRAQELLQRLITTTHDMQHPVSVTTLSYHLVGQAVQKALGGVVRIPLYSPKIIGVASSRGDRKCEAHPSYTLLHLRCLCISNQEDFYSFATLSLNPEELRLSLKKHNGVDWDPNLVGEPLNREVTFVGIYDGYVSVLACAYPVRFMWISTVMAGPLCHNTSVKSFTVYLSPQTSCRFQRCMLGLEKSVVTSNDLMAVF